MKAYKRFEPGLICKGFKYTEGEWVEFPEAKLCKAGAHSCLNPLDTNKYYDPAHSEIREVEIEDVSDERGDDSKVVSKRIKVGAKLDTKGIIKAHVEYMREHAIEKKNVGNGSSVSGGNYSSVSGGYGSSVSGGNGSSVVSRGKSSVGENGIACARGNGCKVKGGFGAVLALGEESDESYALVAWKAVVVDGENIKPDTWYKLVNGEFVEVDDAEH